VVQICGSRDVSAALRGQRLRKEIDEERMTIKSNPSSRLSRSRQGLAPAPGEPELELRRHSALSRLQSFLTDGRKAPKSVLQIRWERRWTAASGAWFAVLAALLLGGIDWCAAVMVAATAFMLARSGDMLDDYDE
jgi:hypothetical protein